MKKREKLQAELIAKLQSMVDSGQDYDRDYHEIWIELQSLEGEQTVEQSISQLQEGEVSLREELINLTKHITDKKFRYAIMFGEKRPFCTMDEDFSCEQIIDEYIKGMGKTL